MGIRTSSVPVYLRGPRRHRSKLDVHHSSLILPGASTGWPAQPSTAPAQRSPRVYPHSDPAPRSVEQDGGWDRRPPPAEHREWERRHHSRQSGDYPRTPISVYRPSPALSSLPPPPPPPQHHESTPSSRRYDPRFDARDQREYDRDREPSQHEPRGEARYAGPPETLRHPPGPPQPTLSGSESPRHGSSAPEGSEKRKRRSAKEKEADSPMAVAGVSEAGKKETKRRSRAKRTKDDSRDETPKPVGERGYKMGQGYKGVGSPEPTSSNGSGSSRSVQPSPTSAHARPSRDLDEDYDEGVAETLIGLASFRPEAAKPTDSSAHSPSVSTGSRHDPSPRPRHHRDSISSTRSHASPLIPPANLKRPLSPGSDEVSDSKRSRVDAVKRRASSPSNVHDSLSVRRKAVVEPYPPSPSLPAVLPPHPRPIGSGHSTSHSASQQMALPPIATLSPASTAASPPAPSERDRDDRMQVDSDSRSISPAAARGKKGETTRSPKGSPAQRPHRRLD
ncbi:TPR protein [Salix suchowensis]|nr:TPR protein [Salix suchowensis]